MGEVRRGWDRGVAGEEVGKEGTGPVELSSI